MSAGQTTLHYAFLLQVGLDANHNISNLRDILLI